MLINGIKAIIACEVGFNFTFESIYIGYFFEQGQVIKNGLFLNALSRKPGM